METSEVVERLRIACDGCDDPEACLSSCKTEAGLRGLAAICVLEDYERKKYVCTQSTCEAYEYCLSGEDGLGICDSAFAEKTYLKK